MISTDIPSRALFRFKPVDNRWVVHKLTTCFQENLHSIFTRAVFGNSEECFLSLVSPFLIPPDHLYHLSNFSIKLLDFRVKSSIFNKIQ